MGSKSSLNSYCLLKMRMKEVEKSNRKKVPTEASNSNQNSGTSDSKPTPDVIIMDELEPKKEGPPPDTQEGPPPGNKKGPPPGNKKGPLAGNKKGSPLGNWKRAPSGNRKGTPPDIKKKKADPNIPVYIYGDYYCTLCDSHMNSEDMWHSHITGKRHIKNLKKGDRESKHDDLDVESSIKYELRNVKDAIVGLGYIQELRKREVGVPPLYTCFLCQSNFAHPPMVIEHVISVKHRLNYIKENSPDDYQLLDATNLKKAQLEPLVTEMAAKLEEKFGSGAVKVKQEKVKQPYFPPKRPIESDDVVVDRTLKIQKHSAIWKPVSNPENHFSNDVKDCRIIIEERRKRSATSVEETELMHKQKKFSNYSKRSRSPSPYSRESSKRERPYSRISHSSGEDYRSYSRSPSEESPRNNAYSSRKVVYSSQGDEFHSRSSQLEQKDLNSKMKLKFLETESKQPESDKDILRSFCLKLYSFPSDLFLKLANLKMDSIQIDGVNVLSELVKVLNRAQSVFCKNFPSDLQAVVNEKMSHKTESSVLKTIAAPNVNSLAAALSSKRNSDLSFLSELINQAKGKEPAPSVSSNVAPHPNVPPYQGSPNENINSDAAYGYTPSSTDSYYNNAASSTMAPPGVPELKDEYRQPYSAYNTQESQYSDPSSSNIYPEYKYF